MLCWRSKWAKEMACRMTDSVAIIEAERPNPYCYVLILCLQELRTLTRALCGRVCTRSAVTIQRNQQRTTLLCEPSYCFF